MSSQNQLSRWGAISRNIPDLAPGAKVFLVADTDDTNTGAGPAELGANFPVDEDGVVRVHTTIQAAVNAASVGRGDVVLVAPGYDHTLGRADSWNTAGVQIIGMGSGLNRPTIRYTTATDEVGLGANNVRVSNIRFLAAVDSTARALDMDSGFAGQKVDHCLFDFNATGNDFRVMIRAAASESVIEHNQFIAQDTAGAGRAISFLGGYADNMIVRNNYFFGQFDTVGDTTNGAAVIAMDTTHDSGDSGLTGLVIDNNVIVSTDTAVGQVIRFGAGVVTERGIISNNAIVTYDCATADTAQFLPGGFLTSQNHIKRSDTTEKLVGDSFQVLEFSS